MLTTSSLIEDRYTVIRQRIDVAAKEAGRSPSDITLLAVSKRQPLEAIDTLYNLGHRDFGENQVQEWQRKATSRQNAEALRWHLIGPIQTNKAKFVARNRPSLVHTVDRPSLIAALEKRLEGSLSLRVLLQVNIDQEPQKAGVHPDALRELAENVAASKNLSLAGLMCIPAQGGESRRAFERMRLLGTTLEDLTGHPLELSMGMSQDFEDAIREGSTIVRVGSALFGPRMP